MSNITVTYRDGRVAQLEQVYIRGSKIRFLILPDMLKNAPMLKSMKNKNQGSGAGRGKAAILKAQGGLWASGQISWISKNIVVTPLAIILNFHTSHIYLLLFCFFYSYNLSYRSFHINGLFILLKRAFDLKQLELLTGERTHVDLNELQYNHYIV